jgi:ADP-heptose:LPS heptosyltransferase
MVRPARRALLSTPPKTVLIQRVDALGDLVVAVPALRRLRQLLAGARMVGLLSRANVDFARTLGLFDEIIVADLVYDPWERRRVVPMETQKKILAEFARYSFDMAIDMSTSSESRLLLPLSRAPVLVGYSTDRFPNLTVEVAGAARDPYNNIENVPHSNHALGLVEWLAAMLRDELNLVPRDDLTREPLGSFGLGANDKFVVLHAGGRWPFTRWPHYFELAEMLIGRTDLRIILLTNDAAAVETLPPALAGNDRFQVSNRRLSFDELDALVTYCDLFVGDDSGVKHLASVRGAKVIGIQNARNNWSEWGQENGGYIVTRKVPCAGCLIQNYPESDECGREFVCITGIRPEEIFDASMRLLQGAA